MSSQENLETTNNTQSKLTMFVGGIPKTYDYDEIESYFQKYGDIENLNLICDSKKRSRGFAFLTYKLNDDLHKCMAETHIFEDKPLDCKISLDQNNYLNMCLNSLKNPTKVFLDDIPKEITKSELEETFSKFGEIEEVILINKAKRELGFAYLTFKETKSAK